MWTKAVFVGLIAMTVGASGSTREPRQAVEADGVYIVVEPVTGPAMVGSPLFDAAVMAQGNPMKQYTAASEVREAFEPGTIHVAAMAESHGGEVDLHVRVVRNGRLAYAGGAQGRKVVAHYNAYGTPYFAVFHPW